MHAPSQSEDDLLRTQAGLAYPVGQAQALRLCDLQRGSAESDLLSLKEGSSIWRHKIADRILDWRV